MRDTREIITMGIYVYILRCADNSFYIGSVTGDDLAPRIEQHNAGTFPGYTYNRRPVVLVWSEYFERITDGIAAERQIKGWSRAKKEALIRSDWVTISQLAHRRGATPSPSSWGGRAAAVSKDRRPSCRRAAR
jgi:putative endonuclease